MEYFFAFFQENRVPKLDFRSIDHRKRKKANRHQGSHLYHDRNSSPDKSQRGERGGRAKSIVRQGSLITAERRNHLSSGGELAPFKPIFHLAHGPRLSGPPSIHNPFIN